MSDACEAFNLLLKIMHASDSLNHREIIKNLNSDAEGCQCKVHTGFGLVLERKCYKCEGGHLKYGNNYFA